MMDIDNKRHHLTNLLYGLRTGVAALRLNPKYSDELDQRLLNQMTIAINELIELLSLRLED